MKEHGILFSGPMIRALLAGCKTQTRRLSKQWMKVKAGDVLWVRENFAGDGSIHGDWTSFCYAADWRGVGNPSPADLNPAFPARWRPSIHMPRWASRITLEATADARLERLQDITEEGAVAEGVTQTEITQADIDQMPMPDKLLAMELGPGRFSVRLEYQMLWDSLHKDQPWASNPELVVLQFRGVKP